MFSSMVDAVHGAFQHEPNPVGDKQAALQLMEADKTVVVANTTSRGVLHLVHGCNQCGYHFCDKASIKESKTGIEESYLVGSALSEWGCDKVVNPYVVHDKGTRKVYAVEFIEAHSEKKSAVENQSEATSVDSKKETSEKKASKTGVNDNVKSKGKAEWPDFSWPHLEAKEEITEKAPRHSVDKDPKSGTKSADKKKKKVDKDGGKAKKVKQTKSKLTSDDSSVSDNKEARKDNIPSAKTLKSDSMLIENGATTADKEAAKKPDDDLTGNVFDDKKSTNHKSTKSDKHKLAASSKKDEEEKKEHSSAKSVKSMKSDKHEHKISSSKETHEDETKKEHSSAKSANSAKSDKHEPKINSKEEKEEDKKEHSSATSAKSVKSDKQHPLDSMLMEHGRATIDKEDFPNLEIPHVIQKLAEAAEEKMSGKVSEDKSVAEKTATVHAKSKSTAESKETKKKDERASSSKLEGSTDALDKHSSAESVMSDKQEAKTSKHKAKASASHKRHSAE